MSEQTEPRVQLAPQQPEWPDDRRLGEVLRQLRSLAPLVAPGELARLRAEAASAASGAAVYLQVGDCAESFDDTSLEAVEGKLRAYRALAARMEHVSGRPVVLVGRLAGEYAKPRSSQREERNGTVLPSFRGHNVNDVPFTPESRTPDPRRLLEGYLRAAVVLNTLRALSAVGTGTAGAPGIWTSHEALILDYEEALLRPEAGGVFGGGAHLLWLGARTNASDGAHVSLLSRVRNPVACKCGPTMSPGELVRICDRLDPWREPGRLTLVFRLGAVRTGELLPPLLGAVREAGREPLLVCDPMHGNPYVFSPDGTRGRSYDDVLAEAVAFPAIVAGEGMRPAGLHLEVAADMVTECAGGPGGPDLEELGRDYRTICDPRLNPEQALAVTEAFAAALRR